MGVVNIITIYHIYVWSCQNVKKYDANEYPGDVSVGKLPALEVGGTVKAGHGGFLLQPYHKGSLELTNQPA